MTYLGLAHIGSCLSALGRYEEAESYLRRSLAGSDDPLTHYNLGLLLSVTGRVDEAVVEYEKALARDPMHSDARLQYGDGAGAAGTRWIAASRGADARGRAAIRTMRWRAPISAWCCIQQGKVGQARVQLEDALRINPQLTPAREALRVDQDRIRSGIHG